MLRVVEHRHRRCSSVGAQLGLHQLARGKMLTAMKRSVSRNGRIVAEFVLYADGRFRGKGSAGPRVGPGPMCPLEGRNSRPRLLLRYAQAAWGGILAQPPQTKEAASCCPSPPLGS